MAFILIDRRNVGRGKSSNNRQKLIKRIKDYIKESIPQNIGTGGVTGKNAQSSSPVSVAGSSVEEPSLAYADPSEYLMIVIGNDRYERGDEIDINSEGEGSGGKQAGQGENSEDDFVVDVARDEFLNIFFEDCELPNLDFEKVTHKLDNEFQQAGFSTDGSPAQLSVIRSFKQSLARRWALQGPYKDEVAELEEELESYNKKYITEDDEIRINFINTRLAELKARIISLHGFDRIDLRYKKKEALPLNTVESVLVMVMDISGSMGQYEKSVARRWFALLYAFIKKRYGSTDLIFIAHTEEVFEMTEDDFFTTRVMGGTSVSPAIAYTSKIIKERYDATQTNIYVCHASDGDNWNSDSNAVVREMTKDGGLASLIRMFSYIEIGRDPNSKWFVASGDDAEDSTLWTSYERCQDKMATNMMSLARLPSPDDCYPIFKKVFKKKGIV